MLEHKKVELTRREGIQVFGALLASAGFAAPAAAQNNGRNQTPGAVCIVVDIYMDDDGLHAMYLSQDGETSDELFACVGEA